MTKRIPSTLGNQIKQALKNNAKRHQREIRRDSSTYGETTATLKLDTNNGGQDNE